MPQKDLHEQNRISWNEATKAHNSHKGDQASFLREGGTTLYPEEIELLGDVRGQTLLHLQCNAGQDTLSIAKHLGAEVTGVDISDEAISFAQQLAEDSGIPAAFIRSDIYDWFDQNTTTYDLVFASYGAIIWLSDIKAWARGVAAALKPGGRFVLVEFHPLLGMFEEDLSLKYDYMGGEQITWEDGIGDYVAMSEGALTPDGTVQGVQDFKNPHPSHEFSWGLADVVGALLDAGLQLTTLREYPYSNGFNPLPMMVALPGRRFTLPDEYPTIAMMYGLAAAKPSR
jgi:SAM-dependent methyltransferase